MPNQIYICLLGGLPTSKALAGATKNLEHAASSPRPLSYIVPKPYVEDPSKTRFLRGMLLQDKIRQQLSIDPGITLRVVPNKHAFNFTQSSSFDLTFRVDGVPLCEYKARLHELSGDRPLIYMGEAPGAVEAEAPNHWPPKEAAASLAKEHMADAGINFAADMTSFSKCLVYRQQELLAAWKFKGVDHQQLPYNVVASDDQSFMLAPEYFHADGTAKVYPNNITDPELQEYPLPGLSDEGTLNNKWFFTTLDTSSSESQAQGDNFNFFFEPGTSQFDETSLFVNAQKTYNWFTSIGYKTFGDKQIKIVVHATIPPSNDKNNALYLPNDSGFPSIKVGDGDGIVLKNLATDADVISHEFGHHVIYNTLTSTQGQSLVIHEGLADFFTFLRTGNPCLGESICPANSPIRCAKEQQCLRTAENEFRFGAANLPVEAHFKSQFISGMMWDLKAKDQIEDIALAQLSLAAVGMLAPNSGYHDLILALVEADASLFSSKYCSQIYSRAEQRGLSSLISDFNCTDPRPSITGNVASTSGEEETTKGSGGSSSICGSVAGSHSPLVSFLLLLPIFGLFMTRGRKPNDKFPS